MAKAACGVELWELADSRLRGLYAIGRALCGLAGLLGNLVGLYAIWWVLSHLVGCYACNRHRELLRRNGGRRLRRRIGIALPPAVQPDRDAPSLRRRRAGARLPGPRPPASAPGPGGSRRGQIRSGVDRW